MIFWISLILAFIPLSILIPVRVINRKYLTRNSKFIFACNHMSNWDPVVVILKRGNKMHFLAKKQLFKKKFKGWFYKQLGGIPVDRENVELTAIKKVFSVLKDNKPVCIFPQGTRKQTPQIDIDSIKSGVAMFSIKTGAPVVPAMFVKKNKIFRINELRIGEPISSDGYTMEKDSIEKFSKIICEKMNALLINKEKNGKQKQK